MTRSPDCRWQIAGQPCSPSFGALPEVRPSPEQSRVGCRPRTPLGATARAELSALTVRAVPVFEHRELLAHSLRDTRQRFLMVTPHIHDAVVDPDFVAQLEILLRRRGFVAHIACGPNQSDQEHCDGAVDRLSRLGERYSNLSEIRLSDSRPPCLIFDDTWINSSSDWLSFRVGPERIYRREEGTLIRATSVVNEEYAEMRSSNSRVQLVAKLADDRSELSK